MLERIHFRNRVAAGILGCAFLMTACNSGTGGSDEPSATQQAARENADDSSEPGAGAQVAPQRAVISERLPYAEVGDELVYGYFVFPSNMIEPLPAIIMIHEWWGLNDNIRAMADRLAAQGYIVLAVDLFGGEVATTAAAARQLMLNAVESPELANENIRAAYAFVDGVAGAPRIASLGWDFGGGWSLNAAMLFPDELDAAVIYYGQVTDDEAQLGPVNAPILGLFGAEDTVVPVASVQAFGASLERLRKSHVIHIYPEAGHAFANPTSRSYDAEVADDAWQITLDFLARNLADAASESTD